MARGATASWVMVPLLLALATVIIPAACQTCDPTPVKWADAPPAGQWAGVYLSVQPLLTEQCNSEVFKLGACLDDLSNQKGCCSSACSAVMKATTTSCLQDYTCRVATSENFSGLLKYQQSLNERCLGTTFPTDTCKATVANSTATSPAPAAPTCNNTTKYPFVAKNGTSTCAIDKFPDVAPTTRLALLDAGQRLPVDCWDAINNLTATCAADLLVRSGCCSATCAAAARMVPDACQTPAFQAACDRGPAKPEVKSFLNMAKRCLLGFVPPCNITNTTYPLKVYDTCDCPIQQSNWKDFSVQNISEIVPVLKAGVSAACFELAVSVLPICTDELQKEDGCCSNACWDALNDPSTKGCYDSYLAAICNMPNGQKYARTFIKTAQRCINDASFNPACPNTNTTASGSPSSSKKSAAVARLPGYLSAVAALAAAVLLH